MTSVSTPVIAFGFGDVFRSPGPPRGCTNQLFTTTTDASANKLKSRKGYLIIAHGFQDLNQ